MGRALHWASITALLFAALAAASPARAQSELAEPAPTTLLLVRAPGDERIVSRIIGELVASAWNVIEIGPDAQLEHADLAQLASSHAAIAALRLDISKATIDLWIARTAGAADGSLERFSATGTDERVLPLRVTEALRARGLTGEQAHSPAEREQPPALEPDAKSAQPGAERDDGPNDDVGSEDSKSRAPLAFPRLWLEVAPAFAISVGGMGPALGAWLDVRLQPAPIASLSVFALAPIWSERLRAPEGSARVSVLLVGAGADVHWAHPRWEIALRAGAGGVFLFMRGDALSGFRSDDATVIVAAMLAGPSLHFDLGAGFRACARAIGGVTLPRVAVRFAERDVAHWGRPFGLATLGLERVF